jgi:hypothetical protein
VKGRKKRVWGWVIVLLMIGAVLTHYQLSVWWAAGAVVFLYVAALMLGWWSLRARIREVHQRTLRWRWSEELWEPDPELQAELTGLAYRWLGTLVTTADEAPGTEWKVPVYAHESLPVYATLIPMVGGQNPRPVLCLLETFCSDHSWLGTSPDYNDAVYWMGAPTGTRRLLEVTPQLTAEALHTRHRSTLEAWIAEGLVPLPATQEAYVPLQEAERDRLRAALVRPGWMSLKEYLAIQRGEIAGCTRF